MKKYIEPFDYAQQILSGVQKGALVTGAANGRVNPMTISWGMMGIEWGKPVFIVFVRESRFTRSLLEANPEFTINIPFGEVDKDILRVCGSKSGRDMDKIAELGLTLETPDTVSVPGIKELPLTLECRVVYKQDQDLKAITPDNLEKYYPQDVPGDYCGSNRDFHIAYYGQIVSAYIIED